MALIIPAEGIGKGKPLCHPYGIGRWFRGAPGYKEAIPQQPVKGAALVGESPTRRIRRFTTERPGACPAARLEGIEQSWQRTDGPK